MSEVIIGNLRLEAPIANAPGPWAQTFGQLDDLNESASGAIWTKTSTMEPRKGNEDASLLFKDGSSINNIGLANPGVDYFIDLIGRLEEPKDIVLSIYADQPEGFAEIVKRAAGSHAIKAFEINASCRNIKQSLEEDTVRLYESIIATKESTDKSILVKVQPVVPDSKDDLNRFIKTAGILADTEPSAVVASNTLGGQSMQDNRGTLHKGSLGGRKLKPIAQHTADLYVRDLPLLPIIGCGGVETIDDYKAYLEIGCVAVLLGTSIYTHGVSILDRLVEQSHLL